MECGMPKRMDLLSTFLRKKTLSYQIQQGLAVQFVRENQNELLRCRSFTGVDYFLLSLHFVLLLQGLNVRYCD